MAITKQTSKLVLGTAQFGLNYGIANERGKISLHEAGEILRYARTNGMSVLDTAIAYGDSEQRLGEIGIKHWQVISKLPMLPAECKNIAREITRVIGDSLKRLKVASLYGLLLHRPQQLLGKNGDQLYHGLEQLKDDGLIKKIGISIYDPAELDALTGRFRFDIIQAPFNLIDNRMVETGWMEKLSQSCIEIHVRSIFLQGLLLMSSIERPQKFKRWQSIWNGLHEWLSFSGMTPLQACLRHVLTQPQIDRVIIGVDSLKQLEEILQAVDGKMVNVPSELHSNDIDLINPSRWSVLT